MSPRAPEPTEAKPTEPTEAPSPEWTQDLYNQYSHPDGRWIRGTWINKDFVWYAYSAGNWSTSVGNGLSPAKAALAAKWYDFPVNPMNPEAIAGFAVLIAWLQLHGAVSAWRELAWYLWVHTDGRVLSGAYNGNDWVWTAFSPDGYVYDPDDNAFPGLASRAAHQIGWTDFPT